MVAITIRRNRNERDGMLTTGMIIAALSMVDRILRLAVDRDANAGLPYTLTALGMAIRANFPLRVVDLLKVEANGDTALLGTPQSVAAKSLRVIQFLVAGEPKHAETERYPRIPVAWIALDLVDQSPQHSVPRLPIGRDHVLRDLLQQISHISGLALHAVGFVPVCPLDFCDLCHCQSPACWPL